MEAPPGKGIPGEATLEALAPSFPPDDTNQEVQSTQDSNVTAECVSDESKSKQTQLEPEITLPQPPQIIIPLPPQNAPQPPDLTPQCRPRPVHPYLMDPAGYVGPSMTRSGMVAHSMLNHPVWGGIGAMSQPHHLQPARQYQYSQPSPAFLRTGPIGRFGGPRGIPNKVVLQPQTGSHQVGDIVETRPATTGPAYHSRTEYGRTDMLYWSRPGTGMEVVRQPNMSSTPIEAVLPTRPAHLQHTGPIGCHGSFTLDLRDPGFASPVFIHPAGKAINANVLTPPPIDETMTQRDGVLQTRPMLAWQPTEAENDSDAAMNGPVGEAEIQAAITPNGSTSPPKRAHTQLQNESSDVVENGITNKREETMLAKKAIIIGPGIGKRAASGKWHRGRICRHQLPWQDCNECSSTCKHGQQFIQDLTARDSIIRNFAERLLQPNNIVDQNLSLK